MNLSVGKLFLLPGVAFLLGILPCSGVEASLGNFVWNDLDEDGAQDAGEPGLEGVILQLWNSTKTALIDSTVSGPAGNYVLTSPASGDYRIRALLRYPQDAFSPKDQAAGSNLNDSDINPSGAHLGFTDVFNVAPNLISTTTLDIGIIQDPMTDHTIGDRVFRAGADGLSLGIHLSSVQVELLGPSGTVLQSTVSDSRGCYSFPATPGTYRLRFSSGIYLPSPHPDAGTDDSLDSDIDAHGLTTPFILAAGQVRRDLDAGFVFPIAVGNFIWSDVNGNGAQDEGEPGIPDVVVELWDSGKSILRDSTTSNASGIYTLRAPGPGDYRVFVLRPLPEDEFTPRAAASTTLDSNIHSDRADFGFSEILTFPPNLISTTTVDAGIILTPGPRKIIPFKVVTLSPGSTSSQLTFTGPSGGTYQISRTPDLRTWTLSGDPFMTTSTKTTRAISVPAGTTRQFFRVRRTR